MHPAHLAFLACTLLVSAATLHAHKQEFNCFLPDDHHVCLNGGDCWYADENYLKCRCTEGFYGPRCEIAKEPCSFVDCGDAGTCSNDGGGVCTCRSGYEGTACNETSDVEQYAQVSSRLTLYNASRVYEYNDRYCRERNRSVPTLSDIANTFINASSVMLDYSVSEFEALNILKDHRDTFNMFAAAGLYDVDHHDAPDDEASYSLSSSSATDPDTLDTVTTALWLQQNKGLCAVLSVVSTASNIASMRVRRESCTYPGITSMACID